MTSEMYKFMIAILNSLVLSLSVGDGFSRQAHAVEIATSGYLGLFRCNHHLIQTNYFRRASDGFTCCRLENGNCILELIFKTKCVSNRCHEENIL